MREGIQILKAFGKSITESPTLPLITFGQPGLGSGYDHHRNKRGHQSRRCYMTIHPHTTGTNG